MTDEPVAEKPEASRHVPTGDDDEMDDDEPQVEVKAAYELATFDEVTIWGQDMLPDAEDDPYAKGMDEWIKFAEAVSLPSSFAKTAIFRSNG